MKTTIILATLLILSINIFSQEIEDDVIVQLSYEDILSDNLENNYTNSVYVEQIGDNNQLISTQQNNDVNLNEIIVYQHGKNNSGYVIQDGTNLNTQINQKGNGNEANTWSIGQNIYTKIVQRGKENMVNNYVENNYETPILTIVSQRGKNNNVELSLLDSNTSLNDLDNKAIITQNGNNLEFSAQLESLSSPLIVEQESGTSGEGMKVEVSNSDFYFPMKN